MAKKAKRKEAKKSKTKAKTAKRNGAGPKKGGRDPAAIKLLKADHRAVEELFEEFEGAKKPADKRSIAREICLELTIHTMIEEEIFYPAIKDAIDNELYGEAHVEHDGAKVLIAEILGVEPSDEFYDARVKVLSEMIKHHVKEEEQPTACSHRRRRPRTWTSMNSARSWKSARRT